MKVLLIKPKTRLISSVISKAESLLPPLGLLYVASSLRKAGHSVEFIDMDFDCNLKKVLDEFKPDWLGMTSTTPSFPYAMEVARKLKSMTKVPLVLGGVHASSIGGRLLEKYEALDYVVKGEGEYAMVDLVNGKPPAEIAGVCYRDNGKAVEKDLTYIEDLNALPFPARDLTFKYNYRDSPLYRRNENHATILFSRGCVHRCIFCDYQTRGRPRFRSAENILTELKEAYAQGFSDFRILDEFFTMNRPLVKEICEGILANRMKITWNCQTRADALTEDMIIMMKKAGCWNIQVGVETGSPRVMEKINKKLDLNKVPDVVKLIKKHGLFSVCFFMIGFPFETMEDIEMTIKYSRNLDCDMVTYSRVTPFPATDLWPLSGLDEFDEETLKKLGIFSNEVYFLKELDLPKIFSRAIRSFYWRPKIVYRLLKEACMYGSFKRRREYVQVLLQGSHL